MSQLQARFRIGILTAGLLFAAAAPSRAEEPAADDDSVARLAAEIDAVVARRWAAEKAVPAPPTEDAAFMRRVYLDTNGTLPTAAEARAFLTDSAPGKRRALVEALLTRPEYADYWASARPFAPTVLNLDNGETFMHFRTRVGLFVEEMVERHPGETVLVVAHGGVVESIFHHIFNIGPWTRCEVWDHNTAITHFECVQHPNREVWRLHFHNRVEHLIGLEQA